MHLIESLAATYCVAAKSIAHKSSSHTLSLSLRSQSQPSNVKRHVTMTIESNVARLNHCYRTKQQTASEMSMNGNFSLSDWPIFLFSLFFPRFNNNMDDVNAVLFTSSAELVRWPWNKRAIRRLEGIEEGILLRLCSNSNANAVIYK